ncbi:MAG: hypothetical protein ACRCYU_09305 [Nocardioides sp.]
MSALACESCGRAADVALPFPDTTFALCLRCVPLGHRAQVVALPGHEQLVELTRAAHQPSRMSGHRPGRGSQPPLASPPTPGAATRRFGTKNAYRIDPTAPTGPAKHPVDGGLSRRAPATHRAPHRYRPIERMLSVSWISRLRNQGVSKERRSS